MGTAGRGQTLDSPGVRVGRSVGVHGIPREVDAVQVALRSSCHPTAMYGPPRMSDTLKPVPPRTLSLLLTVIFSFQMYGLTRSQR